MDQEVWQQLLSLESRDITQRWFFKIHGRELNSRRANEINAAAKQAREYFRNADHANYSVRPLLTFYGVSSLSRSLLLLLRREGGEEGLTAGHGLRMLNWREQLSGEVPASLGSLEHLTVQTCAGLFSDFVRGTSNRMSMHVSSAGVDWRIHYEIPSEGQQISLGDLFERIPDLFRDYSIISPNVKYSPVNEISFSNQDGFKAKVDHRYFVHFENAYVAMGYKVDTQDIWSTITRDTLEGNAPLFVHTYVQKMFGSIPHLYIAEPFPGNFAFSQLCITYLMAFFLGMLARYFPTHWIGLVQGEKGDALWPTINRAQHFVENSYPELVIEMIHDILEERKRETDSNKPEEASSPNVK